MFKNPSSLEIMPIPSEKLSADVKTDHPQAIEVGADFNDGESNVEYPGAFKLAFIMIAECLSIFLVALDQTIVATAIPKITDQFKALDDVGWYGSAYLLTSASFQLIFGRFYTLFSIKWTFLTAIGIFELGSLLCGVAPSSMVLIVGRAIAGVGCAGIFSGALIITAHTVPLRRRPLYSSLIGAMFGVSSVVGPLLGGLFTDNVSWRWCFYINLPIGAVAFAFIVIFFNSPRDGHSAGALGIVDRLRKFDLLGCMLVISGTCCLLLALQWGGARFMWSDRRVIVLLVLFVFLTSAFVTVQIWMDESATVPPRIIKQQSIWSGAFFAASVFACYFVFLFFLPIWFQAIKGVSAVQSGIRVLPMIMGVVSASIFSGAGVTIMGYYTPFMLASTVLLCIGAGLLTTLHTTSSAGQWITYQLLAGLGAGLGIQMPSMAAQNVLHISDVPMGMVVVTFSQQLGSALCVSVGQNVFTSRLIAGLKSATPDLDPRIVLGVGATSLKANIPLGVLERVLEVYNRALVDVFFICVAIGCLSVVGSGFMEWKSMIRK